MAINPDENEGGLGILASASAFVASNRKLLQGEPSSSTTSERGDDSEDGDENCSRNAMATCEPAIAQIGVDLSAMEYAMADYLSRVKDDSQDSTIRHCRLCETSSSSYRLLVEHLITEHRLAVLQSMHDLNLAGMLQQYTAYMTPTQDSPSLFSALVESIREVACTTPSASSGLEPYIKKILDDGPTAWIMEHAKFKKQMQQKQDPLVYPICPKSSRAITASGFGRNTANRVELPLVAKPRPLTSNSDLSHRR